jgi:hypothetical protein
MKKTNSLLLPKTDTSRREILNGGQRNVSDRASTQKIPAFLARNEISGGDQDGSQKSNNVYNEKQLNGRQARWAEELSAYNFVIEHVPGKQNIVADTLSSSPEFDPDMKMIQISTFNWETLWTS